MMRVYRWGVRPVRRGSDPQ